MTMTKLVVLGTTSLLVFSVQQIVAFVPSLPQSCSRYFHVRSSSSSSSSSLRAILGENGDDLDGMRRNLQDERENDNTNLNGSDFLDEMQNLNQSSNVRRRHDRDPYGYSNGRRDPFGYIDPAQERARMRNARIDETSGNKPYLHPAEARQRMRRSNRRNRDFNSNSDENNRGRWSDFFPNNTQNKSSRFSDKPKKRDDMSPNDEPVIREVKPGDKDVSDQRAAAKAQAFDQRYNIPGPQANDTLNPNHDADIDAFQQNVDNVSPNKEPIIREVKPGNKYVSNQRAVAKAQSFGQQDNISGPQENDTLNPNHDADIDAFQQDVDNVRSNDPFDQSSSFGSGFMDEIKDMNSNRQKSHLSPFEARARMRNPRPRTKSVSKILHPAVARERMRNLRFKQQLEREERASKNSYDESSTFYNQDDQSLYSDFSSYSAGPDDVSTSDGGLLSEPKNREFDDQVPTYFREGPQPGMGQNYLCLAPFIDVGPVDDRRVKVKPFNWNPNAKENKKRVNPVEARLRMRGVPEAILRELAEEGLLRERPSHARTFGRDEEKHLYDSADEEYYDYYDGAEFEYDPEYDPPSDKSAFDNLRDRMRSQFFASSKQKYSTKARRKNVAVDINGSNPAENERYNERSHEDWNYNINQESYQRYSGRSTFDTLRDRAQREFYEQEHYVRYDAYPEERAGPSHQYRRQDRYDNYDYGNGRSTFDTLRERAQRQRYSYGSHPDQRDGPSQQRYSYGDHPDQWDGSSQQYRRQDPYGSNSGNGRNTFDDWRDRALRQRYEYGAYTDQRGSPYQEHHRQNPNSYQEYGNDRSTFDDWRDKAQRQRYSGNQYRQFNEYYN